MNPTLQCLKRVGGLCHNWIDVILYDNAPILGREGFLSIKRSRYSEDLTSELDVHILQEEGATDVVTFTFFAKGNMRDSFRGC